MSFWCNAGMWVASWRSFEVCLDCKAWFCDCLRSCILMQDGEGNIYGRGAQDMKSVGMQYLEAIRMLKSSGFQPTRSVHVSYVPDEELGGVDGMAKLVGSPEFSKLNVGINLDEGLACPEDFYRIFFGERSVWKLIIKAVGEPGHGAKLYDGSAMENLRESMSAIYKYREAQFQMLKEGLKTEGEIVAINNVFLRAGTPTPSVSASLTASF